jgi:hypothetical protein
MLYVALAFSLSLDRNPSVKATPRTGETEIVLEIAVDPRPLPVSKHMTTIGLLMGESLICQGGSEHSLKLARLGSFLFAAEKTHSTHRCALRDAEWSRESIELSTLLSSEYREIVDLPKHEDLNRLDAQQWRRGRLEIWLEGIEGHRSASSSSSMV